MAPDLIEREPMTAMPPPAEDSADAGLKDRGEDQ